MTALPADSWLLSLRPQLDPVTVAEYEALPEEICRAIEVVDGYVIFCESPSREHQRAGRRLAQLIEKYSRAAGGHGYGCLEVDTDVDLRLQDVPLLNRRPDVILYRCLNRGEKIRADDAVLVVEIVSPGSVAADTADKFTEYARAGIPHYWIVRLDQTGVSTIERYRLDPGAHLYKHVGTLMKDEGATAVVTNPLPMMVTWPDLEF
jgi:Uma2 family endonuclease